MNEQKKPVDWDEIERDYRAGTMKIRELARWYQLSDTAIRKRAKAEGWTRPGKTAGSQSSSRVRTAPPATVMAGVDATKPENIVGRGRNLILRLLDELDTVTTHAGELENMIVCEEDDARRQEALRKAIDLPSRANVVKALATAFKTLAEAGAPAGKKAAAQEAATTAGDGTEWGDDLREPSALN